MINHAFNLKRAGLATMFSFLLLGSMNVSAQKSVYDVIPGSGPKKPKPTVTKNPSLPEIIRNDKGDNVYKADDGKVYTRRRRSHLPPGQAKKIYGGSAKDYAPGQVKKKHKHGKHGKH